MAQNLSAVDRELEALGTEPSDLANLIRQYADQELGDLVRIDTALEALGEAVNAHFAPVTVEQPLDEQGPESGEYSLGPAGSASDDEPELDVSGELALPDERSGSYELPTAPQDDGAADDPSGAMAKALQSQLPAPPDTEQVELEPFDDEDDEHTTVASAPDVTQVVPTDTLVDGPGSSGELGLPSSEEITALASEQTDIDMMFDELTSPGSTPPAPSTAEQPLSADDELSAAPAEREATEVEDDLARFADNKSQPPPERGYDDDESTSVFDAAMFRDLEDDVASEDGAAGLHDEVTRNASSNPPPVEASGESAVQAPAASAGADDAWDEELSMADLDIEEIDSSELDVMIEGDPDLAVTGVPPASRSSKSRAGSSGPPPPPPGAEAAGEAVEVEVSEGEGDEDGEVPGEERPSLLGRMFGRNKKKS